METRTRIPTVKPGDPIRATGWNKIAFELNRPYDRKPRPKGGGGNNVARVGVIIPARTSVDNAGVWTHTAGGPVEAVLQRGSPDKTLVDGATIWVYSWVKSPSGDPATHPEGKMFILVEQDDQGDWWFTGQDCDDPPPLTLTQTTGVVVDPIQPSPGSSTGLGFTVTEDHPGIWTINGALTLDLTNVGNNTDISVRIYPTIDGVEAGDGIRKDFYRTSGVLETVTWSHNIQIVASDIGSAVDYRVEELTSNNNLISKDARMSFMGPL